MSREIDFTVSSTSVCAITTSARTVGCPAFLIGLVSATHLSEENKDGPFESGTGTYNALDRACREAQAPGPSLNRVGTAGAGKAPKPLPRKTVKTDAKDCQWWVKEAVLHLVEAGMLLPLEERPRAETPSLMLERLPRH